MRLLIDVDEKEFSHLSFNGIERYGSGLNVILHDWNEVPQLGLAVGVPTGFMTYISTEKQVRTMTNEPPWSSCLNFNKTTNELILYGTVYKNVKLSKLFNCVAAVFGTNLEIKHNVEWPKHQLASFTLNIVKTFLFYSFSHFILISLFPSCQEQHE